MTCGHCNNLRLPAQDHVVRNCPVLANTECRYCHQFGHTVSRCPQNKPQRPKPQYTKPTPKPTIKPIKKALTANLFTSLVADDAMPGENAKEQLAEDRKAGMSLDLFRRCVWSKHTAKDLVCSDKAWNLTGTGRAKVLAAGCTLAQTDDIWGAPTVGKWADDE